MPLCSQQESPQPDPDSQGGEEGQGTPADVGDSGRLFAGTWPNEPPPLLVPKFSRARHQTLPDAEEPSEEGLSPSSSDVDMQRHPETPLEVQGDLCLESSDLESDLEVRQPVQPLCVSKKTCSQGSKNVKTLLEVLEDQVPLSEDEELNAKWNVEDMMGECVRNADHHFSARESATGPDEDAERRADTLRARGKASLYCRNNEMALSDAISDLTDDWSLQDMADGPHAQEELRALGKVSGNSNETRVRDEALGQAIGVYGRGEIPGRVERKDLKLVAVGADAGGDARDVVLETCSAAPPETTDTLPRCQGAAEGAGGTEVGVSPLTALPL